MPHLSLKEFERAVADARTLYPGKTLAVPIVERLLSDQLTPVLAYRRLVAPDDRTAPSFLLESVEGGERAGRHSFLGAQPVTEVIARGRSVTVRSRAGSRAFTSDDPLNDIRELSAGVVPVVVDYPGDRPVFIGGWVGYAAYDAVRYAEPAKLASSPPDDRGLPDLHMALYDSVCVFDNAAKCVHVIQTVLVEPAAEPGERYARGCERLADRVSQVQRHVTPLASGTLTPGTPRSAAEPAPGVASNITRERHAEMVERAKEYIRAGDIFQVVIGQRFERLSKADPFDVYRALRAVNPSPYMVYLQAEGCILMASSPEILCRVRRSPGESLEVTNRPLAGTRARGVSPDDDARLERELLADPKERSEHVMLVDLGRNDVGRVARACSIKLPRVMEVERYSHVMHISSTVTGELRPGLDAWDALRAALPVGTISGAPKVRAMQVIDELEPVRRGPYGGGMGYVGFDGQMDIALTLRTIVTPTAMRREGRWTYHAQAAGGIVADSNARDEYAETVNKSMALIRAIELAERAFE